MRQIVLDIESGKINITELTSQELFEIEKFLKEKDER